MPIHTSYKSMASSFIKNPKYCKNNSERTCHGFTDGSELCGCKGGWSIFFATVRKRGWDDTKPMPKSLSTEVILTMIKNNVNKYSDEDIEFFHALGHTLMNKEGDTGCKLHFFIVNEMKRRNMGHVIRSLCDEVVEGLTTNDNFIDLNMVLEAFRSTDIIKLSSSPSVYLSGELVSKGSVNEESKIDVLLNCNPSPSIITAYMKNLPEWLFSRLNFIWNSKEVDVDSSVPIYIEALIPSKKELIEKELKTQELELGKQYITLKPKDTYNNIMESWIKWGGDHIDNGILVEEKLKGTPIQICMNNKEVVGLADFNKIKEELNSLKINSGILEGNIITFSEGKIKGINARGVREAGTINKDGTPILVLTDIIYLDGINLSNMSIKDRISKLNSLVRTDMKYIDIIKVELSNNYKEYFALVRKYCNSKGSSGVVLKDSSSIYSVKYKGDNRTREWINVVDDGSDVLISLDDIIDIEFEHCKFYNEQVCPGSPGNCSLSKYYKCMAGI